MLAALRLDPSQGYVDPFPGDKVLFTITKANAAQYKDKLSEGQLAMLNKYDNFKMNVYQTRRTACLPQDAYDLIKSQSTKVELQGFGYTGGFSYAPFPIPKTGVEPMWNHNMKYVGGAVKRQYNSSRCAPMVTSTRSRPRSGAYSSRTSTPSGQPGRMSTWRASSRRRRSRARCSSCTSRSTR